MPRREPVRNEQARRAWRLMWLLLVLALLASSSCLGGSPRGGAVVPSGAACSPNPCQHGGTCTAGSSGYTCACARGFTGPTCAQLGSATTAMAAVSEHSLAVKSDGTVWAWGLNDFGQLGDGTTTNRSTPVQVLNLAGVVAVAARWEHSLAVKSDGTAWAWGGNRQGQRGDGTNTGRSTPGQVRNLAGPSP